LNWNALRMRGTCRYSTIEMNTSRTYSI
jgi:hypothetical protein